MASTSSVSAASLSTYPSAPACSASRANAGSFCIVSTTTAVCSTNSGMAGRLRAPGMLRSRIRTSGLWAATIRPAVVHLAGLGHHGDPVLGLEQHPEAGTHDRMVVRDHEADCIHTAERRRSRPRAHAASRGSAIADRPGASNPRRRSASDQRLPRPRLAARPERLGWEVEADQCAALLDPDEGSFPPRLDRRSRS